jgi:TolB protein
VVLEVVDTEDFTSSEIGSGSPFYFSWSPDSTALAVHVGATDLGTIELGGDLTDLGATGATYQAPHWTPAGIFHFAPEGLVLIDPAGDSHLLATMPGELVFFVANPQGTKVAIESVSDVLDGSTVALAATAEIEANAVSVLDVTTGVVDVASESTSVGYFWSPDGKSLLVLQLTGETGEVNVSIWEDGEITLLTTMTPPISFFRDVLQFFDQYSQSLRLWAPDSSAVALPGTIDNESGIWVIPTDGSEPSMVFDGEWVAWSYG